MSVESQVGECAFASTRVIVIVMFLRCSRTAIHVLGIHVLCDDMWMFGWDLCVCEGDIGLVRQM